MKSPQQFIWDWAFINDRKIFTNLDKERYWLVWTDEKYKTWNFEHNSTSQVPDSDYNKIKQVLADNGYHYYLESKV